MTDEPRSPMPSLPKPRLRRAARTRGAVVAAPAEPRGSARRDHRGRPEGRELRWINIERPAPAERAWLEEHFDFHPLDYEDVFSRNQRPKVDEYDDYLFVVLHFPRFDKQRRAPERGRARHVRRPGLRHHAAQRAAAARSTTCSSAAAPTRSCATSCFGKGAGYLLYKIVDDCVDASFPMLRKMGNKLERLEDDIFEGRSSEVVRDISNVKQEIINFRKSRPPAARRRSRDLERTTKRYVAEDLDIYFDDINDASERIWDMLENFKEVVEALESTNESVLSHELNDVLRVLTAFSVVILPLTLIASIFGMNVEVPGEGDIDGLLDRHRRDGRAARRHARGVPQTRVPLARARPPPPSPEPAVERAALEAPVVPRRMVVVVNPHAAGGRRRGCGASSSPRSRAGSTSRPS